MAMEETIVHIKQVFEWFPGTLLAVKRQMGKTTSVLQMIHDKHHGDAIFFAANEIQGLAAAERYESMYPTETQPMFTWKIDDVRGLGAPIYVDEWWFVNPEDRKKLMNTGRVVCRIGTEFGY